MPEELFCDALCTLLARRSDFRVVAHTCAVAQLPELIRKHNPNILLIQLDDLTIRRASSLLQNLESGRYRIIILCRDPDDPFAQLGMQMGARGLVVRQSSGHQLTRAILAVASGQFWFSRNQVNRVLRMSHGFNSRDHGRTLTLREREIAFAVHKGLTNESIASEFGIDTNTVKHHLTNIYRKLGVKNRVQLVLYTSTKSGEQL